MTLTNAQRAIGLIGFTLVVVGSVNTYFAIGNGDWLFTVIGCLTVVLGTAYITETIHTVRQ